MNSPNSLENLIPRDIKNKLNDVGVSFSELRQECKNPEKLPEAIYSHWRSGKLELRGTGTEFLILLQLFFTAAVPVFCLTTGFFSNRKSLELYGK